eukprot:gene2986-8622_t
MVLALLLLLLSVTLGADAGGWSRGSSYAVLSFAADCSNYTWSCGVRSCPSDPQRTFHSLGQTNATACTSSSGIDAQGAHYSELSLRQGEDGELAVRYHATADAFTFHRRPKTLSLTKRWPSFSSDGYPAGEQNLTLRCSIKPQGKGDTFTLAQCAGGGAGPGLVRTTRAFGALLRQRHATKRMRGPGVGQLSYWNDNQAGGWEPDNNWLVDYPKTGGNQWGNGTGVAKNWIGRQWDYNQELYPAGGESFVSKLGNLSMTYYTNGFGGDNAYKNIAKYKMAGIDAWEAWNGAHQVLESSQFNAVTSARVNGDGGLDIVALTLPAVLAATVGLGWSKDNLRTADRCYVDGLFPNGEGTSGTFTMQEQQTIFAALSLGPVSISDQLSSYPTNASATITSNVPLVMSTCAATGDLLQSIARMASSSSSSMDDPDVRESDLAPMVDGNALPSSDFSEVPTGTFRGPGTAFPAGPAGWVAWKGDFMKQRTAGCNAVHVAEWARTGNNSVALTMAGGDAILNVAPLIGGPHALLGEQGKVTAVSTYRFAAVHAGTGGNGIVVNLQGKPNEAVVLLFATRSSTAATAGSKAQYACKSVQATIGGDGTASVTFNG